MWLGKDSNAQESLIESLRQQLKKEGREAWLIKKKN